MGNGANAPDMSVAPAKTYGQELHEAYGAAYYGVTKVQTPDGTKDVIAMAAWGELDEKQRDAWEVAGQALAVRIAAENINLVSTLECEHQPEPPGAGETVMEGDASDAAVTG